jgi:hypothetical protein
MKYLIFLLLIACASSLSLKTDNSCKDFETLIKKNWDPKGNKVSLTFLDSIEKKYSSCLINKDTNYLRKIFGNNYVHSFTLCKEAKLSIDYEVDPKPSITDTQFSLYFGIDTLGVVKCVKVVPVKDVHH